MSPFMESDASKLFSNAELFNCMQHEKMGSKVTWTYFNISLLFFCSIWYLWYLITTFISSLRILYDVF